MPHAWISAFIGGMCIGAAALLLLLFNGRIAGISGILSALMRQRQGAGWRLAFVVGLMLAPLLLQPAGFAPPDLEMINPALALVAGLLVGTGTGLGNGCTSGHGICGVGRLSPRSLLATAVFMLFGIVTATLAHLP